MKPSTKLLTFIPLIFLSCTQSTATKNPDPTPTINTIENTIINHKAKQSKQGSTLHQVLREQKLMIILSQTIYANYP